MRNLKRMLLCAVATMAIVAGVAASPASASAPDGTVPSTGYKTQDANVPYLAWQGEHVRLVACRSGDAFPATTTASWMLVDPLNWPDFAPAVDPFTVKVVGNCVIGTWISDKPGIAALKVILHDAAGANIYEKQFLVGWMELLKPAVVGGGNVDAADFCNARALETLSAEYLRLTGPFSNCYHDPQDPRHRIQVTVKGNLPLEADFQKWGLGDHLVLPDDWGRWAAAVARTTWDSDPLKAMSSWDIHDDSLTTEGHVKTYGKQCPDPRYSEKYDAFDAVDNCTGAGPRGGFSTVFGQLSRADHTIGPFDPLYSFDTLLSDGKVDAGDAPMPAAQIDVTIKDNKWGDKYDIGGVGYLYPSSKVDVYSRDGYGTYTKKLAHNLYAPFYSQYIPATTRPVDALGSPYGAVPPSGIDGSGDTDGYGGFLVKGEYLNWSFAWPKSRYGDATSKCLFSQILPGLGDRYRPLPRGINSVSLYTDEAGEADINFVPGLGMYFDNLVNANKNLNNGCDLEGVDPIGKAQVNVVARYPYQPVTSQAMAADPVTFTVHNKFQKTLTAYSKGVDRNNIVSNSVAKIVLAHAQDIDGSPLAYELVCWMADQNAAGFRVFAGDLPAPTDEDPDAVINLDPAHALLTTYQDPWGIGRLCTFTDQWGNTAIEVYNSRKTDVDVIAEFVNEGILRDNLVSFATPTVGQTTIDDTPVADGPATSHVPSPQQLSQAVVVSASGPVIAAKPAITTIKSQQAKQVKKVLHKIRFAKVVTPFHGKAKLQVRVNGKAGLVKLGITIVSNGKTRVVTRFVPANRLITVRNLTIPAKTAKVTVKLIGL